MAATSTYISLSSSVLLEYQYRDQSSNVNEFTTGFSGGSGTAEWFLMDNGHDNSIAIFNRDNYISIRLFEIRSNSCIKRL